MYSTREKEVNITKVNPLMETGAIVADYASKDDGVSTLWFKPFSKNECAAVIDFVGDGKLMARNMKVLVHNQYPDMRIHLYSAKSEIGQKIMDGARMLYDLQTERKKRKNEKMEAIRLGLLESESEDEE